MINKQYPTLSGPCNPKHVDIDLLFKQKKVDPSLQVEVKPSIRARKLQEEKLRRQAAKEEYWRRRDIEERWREEMRYM